MGKNYSIVETQAMLDPGAAATSECGSVELLDNQRETENNVSYVLIKECVPQLNTDKEPFSLSALTVNDGNTR